MYCIEHVEFCRNNFYAASLILLDYVNWFCVMVYQSFLIFSKLRRVIFGSGFEYK